MQTIAIHTLLILAWRWKAPRKSALVVLGIIWLFLILIIIGSFTVNPTPVLGSDGQLYDYYGDANYWCWISNSHIHQEGIALEYVWIWIAGLTDLTVYIFLALVLFDFISVEKGSIRLTSREEREKTQEKNLAMGVDRSATENAARRLLWYPVVYLVSVSPKPT